MYRVTVEYFPEEGNPGGAAEVNACDDTLGEAVARVINMLDGDDYTIGSPAVEVADITCRTLMDEEFEDSVVGDAEAAFYEAAVKLLNAVANSGDDHAGAELEAALAAQLPVGNDGLARPREEPIREIDPADHD